MDPPEAPGTDAPRRISCRGPSGATAQDGAAPPHQPHGTVPQSDAYPYSSTDDQLLDGNRESTVGVDAIDARRA